MPNKVVNVKDISREEWLEYRRKGLGGSDASTIIGLNPFSSTYQLYYDKIGVLPPKEDNLQMELGRYLEECVARLFCEKTGKQVRRDNFMWASDEYDFITANIDREIVGENAGLECKTTSVFNPSDFENGEIPLYYLCQCYHYMYVKKYDRMYLAILVGNQSFYYFCIERNEDEINALISAEVNFWKNHILTGVPPLPDGSESASEIISAIHGAETAQESRIMLFQYETLINDYLAIQNKIKVLTKQADEKKQTLQIIMAENSIGETDKWRITWKPQERTTVDTKRLLWEYPDIYKALSKTTFSRVFRINEIKGV